MSVTSEILTLRDFIEMVGVEKIAMSLEVDESTVYKWKHGTNIPDPRHAYNMIKLSHESLTYNGIYDSFFKSHKQH